MAGQIKSRKIFQEKNIVDQTFQFQIKAETEGLSYCSCEKIKKDIFRFLTTDGDVAKQMEDIVPC